MTNWCSNHLEIKGDSKQIAELVAKVIKPSEDNPEALTFDFNGIFPIPEYFNRPCDNRKSLEEIEAENLAEWGFYYPLDWKVANWGTKDAEYVSTDISENRIFISFETAWSPPLGVYEAICAAYPDLDLEAKYHEGGVGFAGRCKNISHILVDYPCEKEEVKQFAIDVFDVEFEDDEDE